jgi:dTDP-L-rhamnose 4-epimerase
MKVLVTGGAGFIGSHLVDALVRRGDTVVVVDSLDARVHGRSHPMIPTGVKFIRGDVCEEAVLREALRDKVDVVFHEAAMVGVGHGGSDAESYVANNIIGTAKLLHSITADSKQYRPRFVLASTMTIYGEGAFTCTVCRESRIARRKGDDLARSLWDPFCPVCGAKLTPQPSTESQPPSPGTVYAISKLGQELLAMSLGRESEIPVVALRYHNVYGPRMPRDTPYAGVASIFKSQLLAGLQPVVYEDGEQLRDFIHVDDIVQANILAANAAEEDVAFEAFNVGTGHPHRIIDFARELARNLAPGLEPELPGSFRLGDARHIFADVSKISHLGFKPRVSFEDGVSRFAREPIRASVMAA